MAKQERRYFDKGAKVWIHCYENLKNVAHWHFENELVVCQTGTAKLMIDGYFYGIEKGECAFFRAESVHSISAAPGSRLAVAQFDNILSPVSCLKKPVFKDQYDAVPRMFELYRESQKKAPFYIEKMNATITSLLVDIFRGEEHSAGHYHLQPLIARYKQLLEKMEEHCDEFNFCDAAPFMNMSKAYFSRYFKQMTGLTFSQYSNVLRIDRAVNLLSQNPDITMTNLMAECGFNTLRNFNRVFKNITGFSPTQLPAGFSLNCRTLLNEKSTFDPTLASSIVLTG
ncbi:HTH-type transcriptional activator RhaR [bioreactor metagenome]|uniref:HTH-type transcriptional activator RhaR n=1 Tax=bioreactor metagenome TaxID=1076179 RepID=A0A645CJG3_9ZZZZ